MKQPAKCCAAKEELLQLSVQNIIDLEMIGDIATDLSLVNPATLPVGLVGQ